MVWYYEKIYKNRRERRNLKNHSVQFKFLVTVICAMLSIAIFVGGFSIYEIDRYIRRETEKLIESTTSSEASQINDIFGDMEKSVRIMESYVLSLFGATSDILDPDSQAEIIAEAEEMFSEVAKNTTGAIAYYLRLDPAISSYTSGLFYSKMEGGEDYVRFDPTDISLYDKTDTEHVGWFWQPYEAGEPIWMNPYYNKNNNVFMISYVVPLYSGDRFVGVVGMDFDYTVLTDKVHEIKIYENGTAHLELDGVTIHTDDTSAGTETIGGKHMTASHDLENGMTLVLSASYRDIMKISYTIAYRIILSVIVLVVLFSTIVFFMVKKIVKPLKKLTEASIKLSSGDYDVEIENDSNTREIKLLSDAFETMTMNLKEHTMLQNTLAYCDSMTGLRNTTAYREWILDFDKNINESSTSFGVAVLDLNYLKETNDNYGHNVGNDLITTAAHIIADTFKRSPVFRIGGDEFVVILQGHDLSEVDVLFVELDEKLSISDIKSGSRTIPISLAKGFAEFNHERDMEFNDVFNRADDRMYANKREMKFPK